MTNKHGLSRHIPRDIALQVRQRSKFGCVVCRCAIYQYEHIDPEFADATAHDPEKMCLLCAGCHDKVTRRRLAKETVKARYDEVMRSDNIMRPFEELDLSAHSIVVVFGSAEFEYARHLLRINGRDLLSITPPKEGSAFPTLNGVFCDRNGRETLRIADNVWEAAIDAWDIQVVGRTVTVTGERERTALAFEIEPPNKISVTELDMYLENCHVICNRRGLLVGRVNSERYAYIGIGDFRCQGAEVGVDIDSRTGGVVPSGLRMIGGKGIVLDGTGIRIAVRAAGMSMENLEIWVQ